MWCQMPIQNVDILDLCWISNELSRLEAISMHTANLAWIIWITGELGPQDEQIS